MFNAIKEANGFNIVSSKSTKLLPLNSGRGPDTGSASFKVKKNQPIGKQHGTQPGHLRQDRLKLNESVKNIIAREQMRDEKLATRLKKINDKQAERIKEVENQELRN